jgi:hypothetical protein
MNVMEKGGIVSRIWGNNKEVLFREKGSDWKFAVIMGVISDSPSRGVRYRNNTPDHKEQLKGGMHN